MSRGRMVQEGAPRLECWKQVCRENELSKQHGEEGGLRDGNHISQMRSH